MLLYIYMSVVVIIFEITTCSIKFCNYFAQAFVRIKSRGSLVIIAIDYELNDRGFESR
jgi:hypothetical protein